MSDMVGILRLCAAAVVILLSACSHSEMAAVAARVQKIRIDNALYAKSARIRVWKDTSNHDKYGWHIHSQQENKYTLPENEFKTARYLIATYGYTSWSDDSAVPTPLRVTNQQYIIELEWLNEHGVPTGAINVPAIRRESQLGSIITCSFPFVLPDEAYEQFFALPTVGKALDMIKK